MQNIYKKLALANIICILTTNTMAAGWEVNVAPYIWAMNLNGESGVSGINAHVNEKFSDLVKHLDTGAMLWLEANNGRFGLFANGLYSKLSDSVSVVGYSVQAKETFSLYTFGASYTAYQRQYENYCKFEFIPYVGARITNIDINLTVESIGSASSNHAWTDPIIGVRLNYYFNKMWQVLGAADIGGTNFNTDKSCNLNGLIGYSPIGMPCFTFYFGYRWLNQHYETGNGVNYFLWNMRLFGPLLGFNFRF